MRDLSIVYQRVADLVPYDKNPRDNRAAVEKVAQSIREFGFKVPVVVDQSNVIIAGHTRILAAKELEIDEVPTIRVDDLNEEQVRAFRIADNRTTEFATWDEELLMAELKDLQDSSYDIELTGFDLKDINELFGGEDPEVQEDDFDIDEALKEDPVNKPGDIWLLGNHRLMCGDSTKNEDVKALMDGAMSNMVFTDPPYNVDYEGGSGLKIKNDKLEQSAFYQFLFQAYENMYRFTNPGGGIYICHADLEWYNFRQAMIDTGWLLKQCLIWVKNALVMGRQDYHWRHEQILYGWKPGAAHKWHGDRKQTTVLEIPKDVVITEQESGKHLITFLSGLNDISIIVDDYEIVDPGDDTIWRVEKSKKNDVHPTMKPIELCAIAIKNSSAKNEIVMDLFGGSGSTLIAAEQLKRRCYTMEYDPVYADVIVRRYINFKQTDEDIFLLREGERVAFIDI